MPALAPSPKFRAVGSNGLALVGGKLYSYTAGTSTPKDTYTSFTLGAANTNPVILDARGECNLWLNGNYKLVLKDSTDATIWTVDDIRDLTSSATFTNATLAGTLTVSSTAVTWSGNPTHSGNHTFANNVTISGNTTLGDSSADTLTIAPNAVTWTNNPTHSGNHAFSGNIISAAQGGCFSAYSSTAFNIGQSASFADVIYGTEEYDNGGCYNNTTGVFTAPVAGRYRVSFSICPSFDAASAAGVSMIALLRKNGSIISGRGQMNSAKLIAGAVAQTGPTLTYSHILKLAANDTLKWTAAYSDAVSIQCVTFPACFSVELLG